MSTTTSTSVSLEEIYVERSSESATVESTYGGEVEDREREASDLDEKAVSRETSPIDNDENLEIEKVSRFLEQRGSEEIFLDKKDYLIDLDTRIYVESYSMEELQQSFDGHDLSSGD